MCDELSCSLDTSKPDRERHNEVGTERRPTNLAARMSRGAALKIGGISVHQQESEKERINVLLEKGSATAGGNRAHDLCVHDQTPCVLRAHACAQL